MAIRYLTAGESHGPELIAILEGMPAGISNPIEVINYELMRRQKGYGAGPRMKLEKDKVEIVSGFMDNVSTGSPIGMKINNIDHEKWKGQKIPPFTAPRPGHSDLTGAIKYGYDDLRPSLERASARETAVRVAVGSVCKHFLAEFNIKFGGYVLSLGDILAEVENISLEQRFENSENSEVRCPDLNSDQKFIDAIKSTIKNKDTLGGVIEIYVVGVPPGLGSFVQSDRKLSSQIAAAVLSVQAMKGVEIGPAFANTKLPGTQVQDAILLEGDKIVRPSNRAGGIEGGISNGEPIIIRAAMKPIATTLTPQQTVDLAKKIETSTNYERSDFCPVPRAVPIIEAVVAFVIANALIEKIGGDSMDEMAPRFKKLKKASLSELMMQNNERIWWSD